MNEPDYFNFHARLAETFNFKNGLEIGHGEGISCNAFLQNCGGMLTSVDINPCTCPQPHTTKRLRFIQGESPKIVESNLVKQYAYYDYVYIDGDKRKYHVYQDARAAAPLIVIGGIIHFDDCLNVWAEAVNAAIADFLFDFPEMRELKFSFKNPHGSRLFVKGVK